MEHLEDIVSRPCKVLYCHPLQEKQQHPNFFGNHLDFFCAVLLPTFVFHLAGLLLQQDLTLFFLSCLPARIIQLLWGYEHKCRLLLLSHPLRIAAINVEYLNYCFLSAFFIYSLISNCFVCMELDERARRLAEIVVDYSVHIVPGDRLLIETEPYFKPFAELIEEIARKRGGSVFWYINNLDMARALIERNDGEELKEKSDILCTMVEASTANITIYATTDPFYLKGVDPKKIADHHRIIRKPVLDRTCGDGKNFKGVKWCNVAFPCEAEARKAGMSLQEYEKFLYNATLLDWERLRLDISRAKKVFDDAEKIRILHPNGTDICLSLKGRGGGISCGNWNMPDGELYYGPVEDSANGKIYFPFPSIWDGQRISGIRLAFKDGEVVDFLAEENQELLERMLEMNGTKRIGEFGIGFNPMAHKYTNNLLFDEKMSGTVHIALGESYAEPLDAGGGLNEA
ncbi:hypothetical protein GF371_03490, partial [Candidatus Woesearchaeota archaeon]|nr:hypothetical protein [Candidatus Woesearchaeota archaeon]